jgi:hypothetical protein
VQSKVDRWGSRSAAWAHDEEADGWVLLCSSRPGTDCTIDVSRMELSKDEYLDG